MGLNPTVAKYGSILPCYGTITTAGSDDCTSSMTRNTPYIASTLESFETPPSTGTYVMEKVVCSNGPNPVLAKHWSPRMAGIVATVRIANVGMMPRKWNSSGLDVKLMACDVLRLVRGPERVGHWSQTHSLKLTGPLTNLTQPYSASLANKWLVMCLGCFNALRLDPVPS